MIDPGDFVECISNEAPCCGDTTLKAAELPQPEVGRRYLVGASNDGQCNACGAVLPCLVPVGYPGCEWAWPQVLFRKIEPDFQEPVRREVVEA